MAHPQNSEDPGLCTTQDAPDEAGDGAAATRPADERAALDQLDQDMVGQRTGQYRVVRRIGRGGMGMVYEAVHETIGQRAAVKTLNLAYSANPAFVQRFLTEARVMVIAQHPSLVKVFDYGQLANGRLYLLMEFLDGETLAIRIARDKRLPIQTATRLTRQIASALAAAHRRDVLHRDLKPENTFLVADQEVPGGERVKILDFGLAKILHPIPAAGEPRSPYHDRSEGIVGTPAYMAPEQYRADGHVSGKADVYALGVMMFEMLSGELPFTGASFSDLMRQHLSASPPELTQLRADAPPQLSALLARMLAKEPEQRPSMEDVEAELSQLATASLAETRDSVPSLPPRLPTPHQRWPRVARGALLVLGVTGGLATVAYRTGPLAKLAASQASEMVRFAGGVTTLGSTAEEIAAAFVWCQRLVSDGCTKAHFQREFPRRQVALKPFELDRTEVDNEHLARWLNQQSGFRYVPQQQLLYDGSVLLVDLYPALGSGGLVYTNGKFGVRRGLEHRPASQLTWDAADRYCRAQGKRLPTEAEWEIAARSAAGYLFPWGDDEPRCDGVAFARHTGWACGHLSGGSSDVGASSQDRSAQGVLDLAGNVSEWVADQFMESASSDIDYRVVRGGDWHTSAAFCRAATRSRVQRGSVAANIGFRCAK